MSIESNTTLWIMGCILSFILGYGTSTLVSQESDHFIPIEINKSIFSFSTKELSFHPAIQIGQKVFFTRKRALSVGLDCKMHQHSFWFLEKREHKIVLGVAISQIGSLWELLRSRPSWKVKPPLLKSSKNSEKLPLCQKVGKVVYEGH